MKTIILDKKYYKNYQDLYKDICHKLHLEDFNDFDGYENLAYNADLLEEFMWYNHDQNLHIIFNGFDLSTISQENNQDDYEYHIVLKSMQRWATKYPNNFVEIRK